MKIPEEVVKMGAALESVGFEAYLVGGCVRDFLRGVEPKDWDIATNALPERVQELFPESVYENKFGTVGVKMSKAHSAESKAQSAQCKAQSAEGTATNDTDMVEVTTYRKEGKYTDARHPDNITFAKTIEEDLSRRDFTINAMALKINDSMSALRMTNGHAKSQILIDPFHGEIDLKEKVVRTVGNPDGRFTEDALRLMRAVRLSTQLGFAIEEKTAEAIKRHAGLLEAIAKERIRDELVKIITAERAGDGVRMLTDLGLMRYVMPEMLEGIDCGQNKHHIYTVYEHNARALEYTARKGYSFEVRLGSLLHDVGKPRTKRGEGPDSTFYNHEVVGARMAYEICDRLHFSKKIVEHVAHLVRWHLFYYNVGEVSEAGVRRFLRKVGPEFVDDLIKVREADRIGSGVPKAVPYKLRHLLFMIEKVKQDPIDTRMLKLNGTDVMRLGKLGPGPKVGWILSVMLEEILDDPKKNNEAFLEKRIAALNSLSDGELKKLSAAAKEKKEEFEKGAEEDIKEKFHV